MKHLFIAAVMVVGFAAQAQARIQNLSMTPQEMLQQNMNINKPGVPLPGPNLSPAMPQAGNGWSNNAAPITGAPGSMPSNSYMEGFCDPNFRPLISRNAQIASMAACMQQQRGEACRMYREVPEDVRRVLDETINCAAQAAEGNEGSEDEDGNWSATPGQGSHCGASDTRRMDLVKKYWTDQNTVYALVFVPDLVMDNSGNCLRKR
jgi:hypothetical protein